jgi:hypothetical protein
MTALLLLTALIILSRFLLPSELIASPLLRSGVILL